MGRDTSGKNVEPEHHRKVRAKLAELLREPLDRIVGATRLRRYARYDPSVARQLAAALGVELRDDELRSIERVAELVEAIAPRLRGGRRGARPGPGESRILVRTAPHPELEAGASTELPGAGAAYGPAATPAPKAPVGSFESPSPYDEARIGAAAVYCSDGRVGEQMDEFLHRGLGLPRYDRVACPGGPVALAGRLAAFEESRGVLEQVRFLIRVHGLRQVVLIAHDRCAYYRERLGVAPAELEGEQDRDLDLAAWAVRRMEPAVQVQAFFARLVEQRIRFEPVALQLGP